MVSWRWILSAIAVMALCNVARLDPFASQAVAVAEGKELEARHARTMRRSGEACDDPLVRPHRVPTERRLETRSQSRTSRLALRIATIWGQGPANMSQLSAMGDCEKLEEWPRFANGSPQGPHPYVRASLRTLCGL